MSNTIQTGNLCNGKSCEIDHQVVKRRWVVIPKLLVVKGLWEKEGHWEQDALQDTMGSKACGCPGPCCLSSPARARAELSAPRPPLVEKNLLMTTSKEWAKWGEHPDRLLPQGFPEGLTQTSLKASPFPPSLVETFVLVPWTHPLQVHTVSEYSPIYSLLLQWHLTITGCFLLTPAKCGTEVWGWGVSTWVSRQAAKWTSSMLDLSVVSQVAQWSYRQTLWLSGFLCLPQHLHFWCHCGDAMGKPGWYCAWQQHRVSLCHTRHFLPALWLGMYSCARDTGVILVFRHLSWFLICSCKDTGLLFR